MDNKGLLNILEYYEPKLQTLDNSVRFRIVYSENGPELLEREKALKKAIGQKALNSVGVDRQAIHILEGLETIYLDYEDIVAVEADGIANSWLYDGIDSDSIDDYLDGLLSGVA